jgi:P27 family predicted phage terminase small subunit
MKGRKPKPTALKLLAGNPGKRPLNQNEPQYESVEDALPTELQSDKNQIAAKEWRRIIPLLTASGVATEVDRTLLIAYCSEYQKYIEAEKMLAEHGMFMRTKAGFLGLNPYVKVSRASLDMLIRLSSEFGMTPTARVKLNLEPGDKEDETESKLFG